MNPTYKNGYDSYEPTKLGLTTKNGRSNRECLTDFKAIFENCDCLRARVSRVETRDSRVWPCTISFVSLYIYTEVKVDCISIWTYIQTYSITLDGIVRSFVRYLELTLMILTSIFRWFNSFVFPIWQHYILDVTGCRDWLVRLHCG